MFNYSGNFDAISVMLGWMLLRGELQESLSVDKPKEEVDTLPQVIVRQMLKHRVKPSKFTK